MDDEDEFQLTPRHSSSKGQSSGSKSNRDRGGGKKQNMGRVDIFEQCGEDFELTPRRSQGPSCQQNKRNRSEYQDNYSTDQQYQGKRKRAEIEDSYSSPPQNKTRSSETWESVEDRPALDEKDVKFYMTTFERFKTGFENENEKELFTRNILRQTSGQELDLACHSSVSSILLRLIAVAAPSDLLGFIEGLKTDLYTACTDRHASHVTQTLLQQTLKVFTPDIPKKKRPKVDADEEEEEADINVPTASREETESLFKSWVSDLTSFLLENFDDAVGDAYSSPILRVLLQVLGGCVMDDKITSSRKIRTEKQTDPSKDIKKVVDKIKVPEEFKTLLDQFTDKVISYQDLGEFFVHEKAAPVIETLLLVLHKVNPERCAELVNLLMSSCAGDDVDQLPTLFVSTVGSYVIQNILELCDITLHESLWEQCFKNKVASFCLHPTANYIVQTLCKTCLGRDQLAEIAEEICSRIVDIWRMKYFGVIASLCEACSRLKGSQEKVKKGLIEAVQCTNDKQMLVPLVASLLELRDYQALRAEYETLREAPVKHVNHDRYLHEAKQALVQYHGSLILQSMVNFQNTNKIVKSLLLIEPETLVDMLASPSGCHIMDAFMKSSTVGKKHKEKFLRHLLGHYAKLSCDRYGSRVVDAIFNGSPVELRTLIAEEIEHKYSVLKSSCFGFFVLKNINFVQFQRSREAWVQHQAKMIRTKTMFTNMLGEEFMSGKALK